MIKRPIGILDMGIEGFVLLQSLRRKFIYEDFIYINDIDNYPYEGKEEKEILSYVKDKVAFLLSYDIKVLIVVSDTIIEYCEDYLNSLDISVINPVHEINKEVSRVYEKKNMVLLARKAILDAKMYQKYFVYNHLYNLPSDLLNDILDKGNIKTSLSFDLTKQVLKPVLQRDLDIVIISSLYYILLKTEISEYLDNIKILSTDDLIIKALKQEKIEFETTKKGKTLVFSNYDEKEFRNINRWVISDYNYMKLT
ncbi:MAG: hypothetical protein WC278_05515 [Bacilli bacterium]|jgi:glutamate racemase|nr:hypothetical protein [Bacilli bacterium]MDD2682090.1 hypothetical protein [Bacilli bacterium]MDD3121805.1 hypothetical protein [Bacilli bacterium]MDD4063315.1 hypothetical protein [Bacilli bacterium]MDD4482197.1 hypothetical protein [Bacilli bacterium]